MIGARIAVGLAGAARGALGLVLPPRCLKCGVPVPDVGTLCAQCWPEVTFIGAPLCAVCGVPFVYDTPTEALCGACLSRLPSFERARAVLRYDEGSRDLVIAFKHADRTDAAPTFARWLARAGGTLLEDSPLLVPVPLHPRRLRARRYNQSALMTAALARITGLEWLPDTLARTRPTRSQGRLGPAERRRNVRGAFAVVAARGVFAVVAPRGAVLAGRRVVLIDDVLTTGATAEACARALRRGGASAVDVLTLARVTGPGGGWKTGGADAYNAEDMSAEPLA